MCDPSPAEDFSQRHRTFRIELIRALPHGVVETALSTFALFVAIRVFDLPAWQKAAIVSSGSLGLLLSLFMVQLVRRLGWTVNRTAAVLWASGSGFFAISGASADRPTLYFLSIGFALMSLMIATPLMAQIYRKHYPDESRGRLFSYTGLVRAIAAAVSGWLGGSWLLHHSFAGLFMVFSGMSLIMSLCVMQMAPVLLRHSNRIRWFDAFRGAFADRPFRKLLISWMFLGLGNLTAIALFVEYVSNPVYGHSFDASQVGMLTTTIPMLAFIVAIVPWGHIFDRLPFYRTRTLVNLLFIAGILTYYLGSSWTTLAAGIALHGLAKAGGNVLWSLWVTRFAEVERAAEYMSVHTFLTGLRGIIAPAVAFTAIGTAGPATVAWLGSGLILFGSLLLAPELITEYRTRKP